jgi:hypothetical protein
MSVLRDAPAGRIDATTKVNEVLRCHPLTGEVLIQHGPLGVTEPGKFYVQYQDQTVGEYAQRNGVGLKALLQLLNTAAEATDLQATGPETATDRARPSKSSLSRVEGFRHRDRALRGQALGEWTGLSPVTAPESVAQTRKSL